MSKNWSLALIAAFVMGFGAKSYLDAQNALEEQGMTEGVAQNLSLSGLSFTGVENKPIKIFDENDPRVRVVYFGFTHCPDVCPTSLAMLSGALKQIPQEQLDQLRPIFVTLDPERDDGITTHQYAQYFHPTLEGASGNLSATQQFAGQYGVIFKKTELENSELNYTVDHSSYFYFLKPNGELITKVPHTLNPAPIVAAFNEVLAAQ
ncbi:SCO family protein [Vibrio maerlii]|uniref:SCO family protein n=1 Tax=Vibrio maerlii TaxID=2231648 RepID=UPI000E3CD9F7|nr:SCO family protein [Vibrio maerlii]